MVDARRPSGPPGNEKSKRSASGAAFAKLLAAAPTDTTKVIAHERALKEASGLQSAFLSPLAVAVAKQMKQQIKYADHLRDGGTVPETRMMEKRAAAHATHAHAPGNRGEFAPAVMSVAVESIKGYDPVVFRQGQAELLDAELQPLRDANPELHQAMDADPSRVNPLRAICLRPECTRAKAKVLKAHRAGVCDECFLWWTTAGRFLQPGSSWAKKRESRIGQQQDCGRQIFQDGRVWTCLCPHLFTKSGARRTTTKSNVKHDSTYHP